MRKYICNLLFLVLANSMLFGQSSEIGLGLGFCNYWGDMNVKSYTGNFSNARPAAQLFIKYNLSDHFTLRTNLLLGKISGDDRKAKDQLRKERNLHFFSPLYELSLGLDANIIKYNPLHNKKFFTLYLHASLGLFYFNPKTEYNGETIALQPLGTEGQGVPGNAKNKYSRIQLSIPIGGGLKIAITKQVVLSCEIIGRYTFTDYLDDLSSDYEDFQFLYKYNGEMSAYLSDRRDEFYGLNEGSFDGPTEIRGGKDVNDYYFTAMVSLAYVFNRKVFPFNNKVSCPSTR